MRLRRPWKSFLIAPVVLLGLTACGGETTGVPGPLGVETAVVLNSVDISLRIFPVDSPANVRTIGLGPAGSPVTLAVQKNLAAVPLGVFPALAVVDLAAGTARTVSLPDKSGATGVAFVNDSLAYVANPNRNSVSVVNVVRGTLGPEIKVGVFPQSMIASGNRVFILDSELDSLFQPARPARISVLDASSNAVTDSIVLSGLNPGGAAFGPDGLLYVVNSGSFGAANGSLSVVNPATLKETEHDTGFGDFPVAVAFDRGGRAYIGSFSYGIAIWDPVAKAFIRSPSNPLVVQGFPASSSGIAFDSKARLYTLVPNCSAPGTVVRLNPDLSLDRVITVGTCPFAISFAQLTR